ncbi:MAG: single-stranded DNA-binding protein [Treponema sp.]|jgi:single-strand DNA-binding protein|nr:single-stranded DNA-binding protein [Treponema sp.]
MADINHVVLVGRLTRDAELKYTAGGQAVCKFSLAINRRRKSGDQWVDEANFFDVVLWGRQGESLNQYLTKGKMVGVDGELRQDRWEQEGQNRSRVEIVAANIQLLGGGPGGGGGSSGGGSSGGSAFNGGSYAERRGDSPGDRPGRDAPPQDGDDGFADDIPF